MKKWTLLLGLVLVLALLTACGGGEPAATDTPIPTQVPTTAAEPTQEPTAEPALGEIEPIAITEITDITWLWTELIETEPASQSVVADSVNYTLVFQQDNSFNYQADCNFGSGEYSESNGELNFELGPITLAECGPDSLHDQYLVLLASVTGYGTRDGRLVLIISDGAAQMIFDNGGPAEAPEADLDNCSGIQLSSVNIDTTGLPDSWQSHCKPSTPYDNSQPPGPTGMPEHVLLTFGVEDPQDMLPDDPQLYIIPVEAYMQQWEANGDLTITTNVEQLKNLLVAQPTPFPISGMPVLPPIYAFNDLAVQGEYLDISMGGGVRYVGRFAQDFNPVTNDGLFYVFQGFTSDGVYLISFVYPVTSEALPSIEDISDEELLQMEADLEGYLAAKAEELNAFS
ncbi:MAG: META domain-containing protein, partial [Anaerolineales bacterium]|nr:META domain-containing protein [Anaerolineales bacterium]